MKQTPVALGLLLCEQVIIEEKTQNITPVNCFTRRTVERFPSEPFPFQVVTLLIDGQGEIHLEVVIHRLDDFEEIYRFSRTYQFADPLRLTRCLVRIRDCSFPVSGHYQVTLFANKEIVARCPVAIFLKEKKP